MKSVLVTIDTSRTTLDLEVPAEVPIGQLVPSLTTIFAQHGDIPPTIGRRSLELLRADGTPLEHELTLLNAGVVDGARLILSDPSFVRSYSEAQTSTIPASVPSEDHRTGGIGIRWNRDSLFES